MNAKRSRYDWIKEGAGKEHLLSVQDMMGRSLESTKLPANTDLKRALIDAIARWNAEGWTVETFSSEQSHFFCHKGNQRLHVTITPATYYQGHR